MQWSASVFVVIAAVLTSAVADVNPLLKEVIYTANQEAIKNHKDAVDVPAYSHEGFFFKFYVAGGKAENFSTLQLLGDDQVFNQTDETGYSVYDLVLNVGLKTIKVELNFSYKFLHFFTGSGTLNLSVGKNSVQPKIKIVSYDNGTCTAVLESAVLTQLGDISINISPASWTRSILKHISGFVANHLLPHFLSTINLFVKDIVENKVPNSDFSKTVCKPFEY